MIVLNLILQIDKVITVFYRHKSSSDDASFMQTSYTTITFFFTLDLFDLPTERTTEASLHSPASQTAGTEGVVTVKKTGVFVLLMAQVAHQGVAIGTLRII